MKLKSGTTHRDIITNKLFLVKHYGTSRTRFYFPEAGLINGLQGFKNIRFSFKFNRNWYSHFFIRFPFFYFEKGNFEWSLGLPNLYLRRVYLPRGEK